MTTCNIKPCWKAPKGAKRYTYWYCPIHGWQVVECCKSAIEPDKDKDNQHEH